LKVIKAIIIILFHVSSCVFLPPSILDVLPWWNLCTSMAPNTSISFRKTLLLKKVPGRAWLVWKKESSLSPLNPWDIHYLYLFIEHISTLKLGKHIIPTSQL